MQVAADGFEDVIVQFVFARGPPRTVLEIKDPNAELQDTVTEEGASVLLTSVVVSTIRQKVVKMMEAEFERRRPTFDDRLTYHGLLEDVKKANIPIDARVVLASWNSRVEVQCDLDPQQWPSLWEASHSVAKRATKKMYQRTAQV